MSHSRFFGIEIVRVVRRPSEDQPSLSCSREILASLSSPTRPETQITDLMLCGWTLRRVHRLPGAFS